MPVSATALQSKTRSGAIDAVRVLGIVAVVAGHTWDNAILRDALYLWHVPVFFVLSGYLWSPGRSVREEIAKRSRTLLLPYALWLLLISAPYGAQLYSHGDLSPAVFAHLLLGGSYVGRPFSAFWFVTALFVAAVGFRLLQKTPVWARALFITIVLGIAFMYGPLLAKVPLSIGVALPCIAFLMTGEALRQMRSRIIRPALTGFGALMLGFVLAASGAASPLDLKPGDFGTPGLSVIAAILISCGLVLVAEVLLARADDRTNQWFTRLAGAGFMVILTHSSVLWVLGAGKDSQPFVFLVALFAPWVAAMMIARTRLAPSLLGTRVPAPRQGQQRPDAASAAFRHTG